MEQEDYKMVQDLSEKYKIPGVGKRVLELWRQCTDSPLAFRRTLTGIVKSAEGDLTQEDVETLAQEAFKTADRQWSDAERKAYDATLSFYEAIARRENVISAKTEELAQLEAEMLGYRTELRKAKRGLKHLAGTEIALERAEKKVKNLKRELGATRKERRSLGSKLLMTEGIAQANETSFQMAYDEGQQYKGQLGAYETNARQAEEAKRAAEQQLREAAERESKKLDREALLRAMESYQSRARKVDTSGLRALL